MLENSGRGNDTMITGWCGLPSRFGMGSVGFGNSVDDAVDPSVEALEAVIDSGKLIAKTLDRVLQFGSVSAELIDPISEVVGRVVVVVLVALVFDIRLRRLGADLYHVLHVSPGNWSTGRRSRRLWCRFGGALFGWHDEAKP